MRRQAHAAGYSWRKWEDPIIYRGSWRAGFDGWTALYWATAMLAGATAAVVLFR